MKQITSGTALEFLQRKSHYEEAVKKQIIHTLVEYFKEELAPKEEVTKLQGKLEDANKRNSIFFSKNETLTKTNGELSNENEKLKDKVKKLTEESRKLVNRILSDPTIPPENREFPFRSAL